MRVFVSKTFNFKITTNTKDFFSIDILGLSLPINIDNIKKSYKKLVKIFHPDVNNGGKKAEKKFIEINEAYKMLLRKSLKQNIIDN